MDALPELLTETLGDSTVIETVDIGGGDAVAVTPEETHVYRSDGLLSDESIETFGHETDRLSVRTKRRKSEIRLETIDSETSFTVPSKVADSIVEAMIEGILRTTGVIEPERTVTAQFRFSELTLVVTDGGVFEHVGAAVWDGDFETVEYNELTGLAFEKGSVATQVVLETKDRRRRVKVPNEHAGSVRRQIQEAVFEYHDVSSLEELRAKLAVETDEPEGGSESDIDGESNVEPDDEYDADWTEADSEEADPNGSADSFVSADWTAPADRDVSVTQEGNANTETMRSEPTETDPSEPTAETAGGRASDSDSKTSIADLTERVEALSRRVDRQTELIESQRALIEQLVDELRRGR